MSILAWTATTSTVPTIAASLTPTTAAASHALAVHRHAYAQKDRARHSANRRSPNAITNATTMRTTSIIAVAATKPAPRQK